MANIFKSKFTGEQIEEILDKANNVTDVQANNGEPTTADLSTLKIGDVNYKIPEPSAPETPTIVEANPSGDATAELSKLKVGETIYSIPTQSGGGGVKLYKHKITFNNAVIYAISTTPDYKDYFTDNTAVKHSFAFDSGLISCRYYDQFLGIRTGGLPEIHTEPYDEVFVYFGYMNNNGAFTNIKLGTVSAYEVTEL